MGDLVCGRCRACCWHEVVPLMADEDASAYETEVLGGQVVLAHRTDGSCVYLKKGGCSIYERRPAVCRAFDCRRFVVQVLEGRHDNRLVDSGVMMAGLQRLPTLKR